MEVIGVSLSRFYRLSELLEEDGQSAEMCMQGELLARYRQCLAQEREMLQKEEQKIRSQGGS